MAQAPGVGQAMTHNQAIWMEQDLAAERAVLQKLGPHTRGARFKTDG
jgi:hypothetical protein